MKCLVVTCLTWLVAAQSFANIFIILTLYTGMMPDSTSTGDIWFPVVSLRDVDGLLSAVKQELERLIRAEDESRRNG